MNNQEIFNKVVTHLVTQGKPSFITLGNGEMHCRYRGPDNTMCAAGCLIKDAYYHPDLEGDGAWAQNVQMAIAHSIHPSDHDWELVTDLQRAHDQWARHGSRARHSSSLYFALENIAREYELDMPEGLDYTGIQ